MSRVVELMGALTPFVSTSITLDCELLTSYQITYLNSVVMPDVGHDSNDDEDEGQEGSDDGSE